jgi:hypothetical protein
VIKSISVQDAQKALEEKLQALAEVQARMSAELAAAEKAVNEAAYELRLARHAADAELPRCELWQKSRWARPGAGFKSQDLVIVRKTPTGQLKVRTHGLPDSDVLTCVKISGVWRVREYRNKDDSYWLEGVPPEFDV